MMDVKISAKMPSAFVAGEGRVIKAAEVSLPNTRVMSPRVAASFSKALLLSTGARSATLLPPDEATEALLCEETSQKEPRESWSSSSESSSPPPPPSPPNCCGPAFGPVHPARADHVVLGLSIAVAVAAGVVAVARDGEAL
eukprot:CAMPEP_0177538270 /NCGR_PEP_ID=MMETSP0369-20130122/58282_1 /TAXON_ID=447022 ORGANISM="Scrippsiella hangoei-like, Strain SHHI-4" /NCGR_SAMPLE_ID=MMETSP0369 /ASSEMBLY_ACC=CAM_ASM_000364 /LENGTH=140 /DNA_ID=CAMNT_0019021059 /DNA_START=77 /DNA_END=496 /DNA_ORIENTATION=-